MLKPISFPVPLPDDPRKWDGWSRYNSPDPYERLCLDPRTNPSNELIEERFTRDELYTADEAFFTGTAAELTPIREVDDRQIGAGRRGPVTEDIQNAFFDIIKGKNGRYEKWLAYV